MKVLQINGVYGIGSTGKIVKDIEKALSEFGHESYVAFGCGIKTSGNHYIMESRLYQKVNIMKTRFFGKHGFYNNHATKKLLKWIDSVQPDIIHLHNIHGHYINIKILFEYLKKINKPVIWTLHDCWSFTGHCAHFEAAGCNKWRTGCHKCPIKRNYPKSLIFDRSKELWEQKKVLFTSLDNMTIITPSQWLCDLVRKSYLKKYPIKIINNGTNLTIFKASEIATKEDIGMKNEFVVLGMADKWLSPLNAATIEELVDRLDEDIAITLIGCDINKLSNKLKKRVNPIAYINNPQELAKKFSVSDVFVNLTLEDTFPTVNIEALACGTPVITYNTGGSPEIIDKNTGIVVNKHDVEGLLYAIRTVKNNGKGRYHVHCINRAIKLYNEKERCEEYIKLYSNVRELDSY